MKKSIALLLAFVMLCSNAAAVSQISLAHLQDKITGNYGKISEFVSGYAVIESAKVGYAIWDKSEQKKLIIDKNGKIVMGPINGNKDVKIIDAQSVYIEDNDTYTSKIVDMKGKDIASFNGRLLYDGKFNKYGLTYMFQRIDGHDHPAIVNRAGKILVLHKNTGPAYTDVNDEHFVFINHDHKSALIYNSDGTYSHTVTTPYMINGYKWGKLTIFDEDLSHMGLMDLNGNIIVEPKYYRLNLLSNNRIMAYRYETNVACLLNENGNTIKTFMNYADYSPMYDGKFLFADNSGVYLMNHNGEILRTYTGYPAAYVDYCGSGVFSIEHRWQDYQVLVDGKTGELIGDKYDKDYEIEFNGGYAGVEDLHGEIYIIDKDGNKFCQGYKMLNDVSCNMVIISNANKVPYIIYLPQYKTTKLIISGKEIILKDKAQKKDGRTFYPLRECMENMGADVTWDAEKQIARGKYNGKTVEFIIGKNYYYINGVRHTMDTVPYIDKSLGKTFIPVRYAAEAIGYKVDWTGGQVEDTINIYK